ncbi:Pentatricopeptide repeat (PPR) superfamily protein [Parasponia andersonii]|uniref:Pentatricopeptide repeat (PPR) superfamily protein n=1 Tax=Parasponia andersonii TaxID=3476 RepID=A0A2P5B8W8_PARAD|nr:Pentatricopeptide repeat (PPR) superfamily protein [Parasponia andersonii]
MALTSLGSSSPWLSRLSLPYNRCYAHNNHTLLFKSLTSLKYLSKTLTTKASLGESETSSSTSTSSSNGVAENYPVSEVFDVELLNQVSGAKDAYEVLQMIEERSERSGGFVSVSDCLLIISAALDRNNPDLALSVFNAMRSSFDQGITETGSFVEKWKWSRPDVRVYTSLVQGLAASLRVSDALRLINQVGVSPAEEVPFGKVVRCPSCMIAVAVAQPQQGIQIASCSKCRYQYELVSGNIVSIESEEISMDVPAWQRGLRFLQINKRGIPAAVHSIVVQTPSGMARTYRFATEIVDLPAQEGERVTIALAAPSNVYRQIGPFKFSPKSPNFYPGEPICLTNHEDDRESQLLRAPVKDKGSSLTNPSILFPLVAVLASGDAASGVIDPSLPQFISVAAVASLAVGATLNTLVFPQLSKLPQRSVDTVAIKQQLLSQYDILQSRIRGLKEAAEKEVWMLARMCQLEIKIFAVGEPTYRARRNKIKKVREGLENSLRGQIELIDSYARISSMIEIEVEMDSEVLAAEAASNAESIAEQIQQIMELENLEEACAPDWSYYFLGGTMGNVLIDRWKLQAEANDEAERLLSS